MAKITGPTPIIDLLSNDEQTFVAPKHSAGSWIADGNGFERTWDISNSKGSIATVTTTRADADLIAAAPEMLDVIQDCHDMFVLGAKDHEIERTILKLRSVLAKAKGQL